MAEQQIDQTSHFTARQDQALIGIIRRQDGKEFIDYFTAEEDADTALDKNRLQKILSLFGAWSDLDWETALEELDRIRHESKPSSPLSL